MQFGNVARDVTKIAFPETRLGIIPGAGGTQRAPRLIGLTKAKELIFTGRSLTAAEAHELGEQVISALFLLLIVCNRTSRLRIRPIVVGVRASAAVGEGDIGVCSFSASCSQSRHIAVA